MAAGEPSAEQAGVGHGFATQQLAEQWLTESYEDLVEDGWADVWLYEGDRLVYGPMSLSQ